MNNFVIIFKGACTGLDFDKKCEESNAICEAVFHLGGFNCDIHCEALGLECEGAWNADSGTCTKDTSVNSGCNVTYSDAICRCTRGK